MTDTPTPSPRLVALALSLSEATGERWAASTRGGYAEDLNGPASARLTVEHCDGRLIIDGCYPSGAGGKYHRITAAGTKDAQAVARDIKRRLLDAGYTADLAKAVERKAAQDAREAERAARMSKVAALFGEQVHEDGKVYLGKYLRGSGYVEAYYSDEGDPALNIDLSGIPDETALAMLKVLADSPGTQARCCRIYGPHHDARLSRIGCVRGAHTEVPAPGTLEEGVLYDLYCKQSQGGPQPGSWEKFAAAGLEPATV
jgi:hypothetical protein